MDANDDDDLTDDAAMPGESMDGVTGYRARASEMLDQIAQQVKQALADADIDLGIFFMIPSSGHSILTFGTITDPPDDQWRCVAEIVSSTVRQTVGLRGTRCRSVVCATTQNEECCDAAT